MNIFPQLPNETRRVTTTWNVIKKNWLISVVHKFVIALFILSVGLLVWRFPVLPPQVPVWFSRPWGADQLASPYWLILLPVSSIFWYGIDLVIGIYVTTEYLIFTQMLFLSALIVSILSFITLIKILFLVS
ncbi:MAG: hypothetical protein NTY06_01770 [Candidatus Gottesmanbacteria bacterium]|nr:hypothetical protein [Candidatus Gottesmanbacteria bacterium]